MKNLSIVASTTFIATIFTLVATTCVTAQTATYSDLKLGHSNDPALSAELGMLICEDLNGNQCLCSGALEETVLGIVTNVPYITLNKPTNSKASKYVFEAQVSEVNGSIERGDYLRPVKGGLLAKCGKEELQSAYAVALDSSDGEKLKVKILRR